MTSKDAALLYINAGFTPPPEISVPNTEHIRNTRRKVVEGVEFRSTLEATAFQVLQGWQRAGLIRDLKLQPQFILQNSFRHEGILVRAMTYRADFSFICESHPSWNRGDQVIIEAKGFRTQPYALRRKLFLARYPTLRFQEWTKETLRSLT